MAESKAALSPTRSRHGRGADGFRARFSSGKDIPLPGSGPGTPRGGEAPSSHHLQRSRWLFFRLPSLRCHPKAIAPTGSFLFQGRRCCSDSTLGSKKIEAVHKSLRLKAERMKCAPQIVQFQRLLESTGLDTIEDLGVSCNALLEIASSGERSNEESSRF